MLNGGPNELRNVLLNGGSDRLPCALIIMVGQTDSQGLWLSACFPTFRAQADCNLHSDRRWEVPGCSRGIAGNTPCMSRATFYPQAVSREAANSCACRCLRFMRFSGLVSALQVGTTLAPFVCFHMAGAGKVRKTTAGRWHILLYRISQSSPICAAGDVHEQLL